MFFYICLLIITEYYKFILEKFPQYISDQSLNKLHQIILDD